MKNDTIVAFSHSKHRNAFGMVGIEIDEDKKIAFVRLAKQWKRENINKIPIDVKDIYKTYMPKQIKPMKINGKEIEIACEYKDVEASIKATLSS